MSFDENIAPIYDIIPYFYGRVNITKNGEVNKKSTNLYFYCISFENLFIE